MHGSLGRHHNTLKQVRLLSSASAYWRKLPRNATNYVHAWPAGQRTHSDTCQLRSSPRATMERETCLWKTNRKIDSLLHLLQTLGTIYDYPFTDVSTRNQVISDEYFDCILLKVSLDKLPITFYPRILLLWLQPTWTFCGNIATGGKETCLAVKNV